MQVHGKKILKLLQKIFSWLPLATIIDRKVVIVHGGISDRTDFGTIARVDRHKVSYVSVGPNCIKGVESTMVTKIIIHLFTLFFGCMQYASTLRPHHATSREENQSPANSTEASGLGQSRRRVRSLTHNNSVSAFKHHFPRRSLHNQPTSSQQPNWSLEEELKRRRRMAGFDQSYGEPADFESDFDSGLESGETTKIDEQEWKQVCQIIKCKERSQII